jgi:hypothetical protein
VLKLLLSFVVVIVDDDDYDDYVDRCISKEWVAVVDVVTDIVVVDGL